MPATPFDSAIYRSLFGDPEIAALFSESAEIRAMLVVEGALAKAQGNLGIIPQDSAFFIHRASFEAPLDPTLLGPGTAAAGIPVPALVEAFRAAMNAPEHAAFVHWGATTQDIMDTGLVLRLRRMLDILDGRISVLVATLANKADIYRGTPMAARTRNQIATPTSFGAKIIGWAAPLLRHQQRIADLRPRLLQVSLAGASGTMAAMDGRGFEVAAALAAELGLGAPDVPWHNARDCIAELGADLAHLAGSLGKIGQDMILLMQSEVAEITAGPAGGGASSTMPHKANPVGPETLVTLARFTAGMATPLAGTLMHSHERDGSAWAVEWLILPQLCIATASALRHAQLLAETLEARPLAMQATITATNGLMMAEAASFALACHMPRPEAQALVKSACKTAILEKRHLGDVLAGICDLKMDWEAILDPLSNTGEAEEIVRRFVDGLSR